MGGSPYPTRHGQRMTRKTGPIIRIRVLLLRLFSKWFGSMWPRVHVMSSKRRCVLALRGLTNPASKLASSRGLSRCWKKCKPQRKLVASHSRQSWIVTATSDSNNRSQKTAHGIFAYQKKMMRSVTGPWNEHAQKSPKYSWLGRVNTKNEHSNSLRVTRMIGARTGLCSKTGATLTN